MKSTNHKFYVEKVIDHHHFGALPHEVAKRCGQGWYQPGEVDFLSEDQHSLYFVGT
jgi:hypothetical protein